MKRTLVITTLSLLLCIANASASKPLILKVTDYGIDNDGKTLNTEKIQACINRLSSKRGGTLIFPKGRYLTGTIELKPNVHIVLEEGAVLLGSTDPSHYHKIEPKDAPRSPRDADNSKLALLVAYRADNISITGPGTIDGQGRQLALTVDSILYANDAEYRQKKHSIRGARPSETYRPKIINFNSCSHVKVSGCTIRNSACWVQTYELCHDLVVDGVKVYSRAYWNNDGLDVTDCRNVRITNCYIDSADDGICLKSYYPGFCDDSVSIRNCTVVSSASAVKIGTASIGGFRNIEIDSIRVFDTYRSAIAIESVDGGFIESVKVSRISASNTGNPIFIRLGHRFGDKPGHIKNVLITDLKAEVPFGRPDEKYDMRGPNVPFIHNPFPSPIAGIEEAPIENVALRNICITYPGRASKGMTYVPLWSLDCVPECVRDYPEFSMFGELPAWGFYVRHVKHLTMENIRLRLAEEDFRPAIVLDDVTSVLKENMELPVSSNRIIENKRKQFKETPKAP